MTVLGDFRNAKFAYAGTTSNFFTRDGRYFVRTDGPDGKLADFEIRYTFGVEPLQQYLIELPGGRLQALGIAWDTRPKAAGGQRWFHLYPGQNLRAGDPLHWTGVDQNWNFMCAECHSTGLRKNFDAAERSASRRRGRRSTSRARRATAPAPTTSRGRARRASGRRVSGGGQRARRRARRAQGRHLDARAGDRQRAAQHAADVVARDRDMRALPRPRRTSDRRFRSRRSRCRTRTGSRRLDEGLYWTDGQIRDEVYEWGSFVQSKMFAAGVTCADCHDPHSLGLRRSGNDVCAHATRAPSTTPHRTRTTRTAAPGAACVACHMPTTTYMQIDARHDHSLRVPRPDLAASLGTPNACAACHAKKSAQWAADAIKAWTGRAPAGFQNFGGALRAGSDGAPGARGALLTVVDDPGAPAIARASAIDRLGRMLTPSTLPAVSRALNDPDSVVRLAAVEAIGAADVPTRVRYLPRMLADPVKSVRIEAARALAGPAEARIPAGDRDTFARALDEYIAVQTYNADRPEGRMSLGNLYASRGDPARAIAEFRQAIALDPSAVEARANLADLYRSRGAEAEAEAVLREGLAKSPRAAALHYALGLTLVRQKRATDGLRELGEASKLAPDNARFAYVYAVALADAGKRPEALRVLGAALKAHPYDRDVLFGLAHYSAAAGQRDAALGYAKKLAELDPENPDYARLAVSIAGAPAR